MAALPSRSCASPAAHKLLDPLLLRHSSCSSLQALFTISAPRSTMKTLLRTILFLPCVILASVAEELVCPPPPEFPEATLMRYTPAKALYKCAEGYDPHGGSPVIRCSGGQWGNLTLQCQKMSCGNAGELLNGYFKYEGESLLGDKAYAICEDGYTLKGPKVLECGSAGWPTALPTCEEGIVTCSAPKVANSETKDFTHEYKVGDTMTIRCSRGFLMKGAGQITCGSDGQWQPPLPQCEPVPEGNGKCDMPDNPEDTNARLAPKYSSQKSFAPGARVYYVCDVGYVLHRGSKYRFCIKGKWSPLELRCRRRLCGSAGELQNGHYEYTGVEFGDIATAVCDDGFQLVGHPTRNCLSRGWDGHPPVCDVLSCEEPPEVPNAEIIGLAQPPYEYRTVVSYRCLVGSMVGPSEIWCTQNGTWSSPLPQCKDVTCAPPNIPNASWTRSQSGRYQLNDSLYIHCNPRYTIAGPRTITCGRNGQWFPELPRCGLPVWSQWG